MKIVKMLGMTLAAFGLLAAQVPEDPVLRARNQRGLSANLSDSDLPPVPRTITEPPPLPPPETHIKDMRGYRRSKRRTVIRKKAHRSTKGQPRSAAKRTVRKK